MKCDLNTCKHLSDLEAELARSQAAKEAARSRQHRANATARKTALLRQMDAMGRLLAEARAEIAALKGGRT